MWGYMGGVNGLVGHELIHKNHMFHKIMGIFTFMKITYAHFA
jgi:hypothetical protein